MKKLLTLLSLFAISAVTATVAVYIIHKDDCNKRYDNQDLMEN